jgi:ribosomal protein S18 acetylase RimI-like enzyme
MARQGGRPDAGAKDGRGIEVRELTQEETAQVDAVLPLSRLDGAQTYLVAWLDDDPVGHAHIAWRDTKLGLPEIQDVFVRPDRRRRGAASALNGAAERLAAARGYDRISVSASVDNVVARRLYEQLGYEDAGVPLQRVEGAIVIRGKPMEVDDTLIYLVKQLPVDSSRSHSS